MANFDFLAGLLTISLTVAFPTFVSLNKTKLKSLEARVGIEPTNAAFAEPCLTTWRPRLPPKSYIALPPAQVPFFPSFFARVSRALYFLYPRQRRFFQSSRGLNIPAGVIRPVINSAGVTSNPGLRAWLVGLATRT